MLKKFLALGMITVLLALALGACGDPTATPVPPTAAATTAAATTAAANSAATTAAATTAKATTAAATSAAATTAAATTAAATSAGATTAAATSGSTTGGLDDFPIYAGAKTLTVPDAVAKQFETSAGSSITNPQVGAFVTADASDKVKGFYADFASKNGWTDLSSALGSSLGALTQQGGFYQGFLKGKRIVILLGLPSSLATGLGISASDVPANGTLVMGFYGEAASGLGTGTATTTTAAATAAATTAASSGTSSAASDLPTYPGAKEVTLPDNIKTQFASSVGSQVVNPQLGAFVSTDGADKIKAYYSDFAAKNGWKDITSAISGAAGTGGDQISQLGGFFQGYSKDKSVFVMIGLPSSLAAGFGVPASDIPANGTLVLGFFGQGK